LIALAAMLVLRLWGTNRIANFGAQVAALMYCLGPFRCHYAVGERCDVLTFPAIWGAQPSLIPGPALAAAAVVAFQHKTPQIWLRPTTLVVVTALACAQLSWDLAATHRWRVYIADVRSRLARSEGLISWEQALALGDRDENRAWQAMDFGWTMSSLSVDLGLLCAP